MKNFNYKIIILIGWNEKVSGTLLKFNINTVFMQN